MQKFNMWETQIFRAEQTLSDDADKITENDKKELQDKLDAMKAVFNVKPDERDMSACEAAYKELQTVQWKVSEALYKAANPDASTANPFGQGFDFSQTNPNTGGGQ
jgi:molecular chaperone DnaK (HSP70)